MATVSEYPFVCEMLDGCPLAEAMSTGATNMAIWTSCAANRVRAHYTASCGDDATLST
jgi:hypothetical protein